jgi:hypothetical protein
MRALAVAFLLMLATPANAVFVQRDEQGNIKGVYADPQSYAKEELADDDPAVAAFYSRFSRPIKSDAETLIDALIKKGVISQEDIEAEKVTRD